MNTSHLATTITTLVLIAYIIALQITALFKIALVLFLVLHVLLILLVFSILQAPNKVSSTFEEQFYQDKNNDELDVF